MIPGFNERWFCSQHPAALDGVGTHFSGGNPTIDATWTRGRGTVESSFFFWDCHVVNCCATARVMGLIVGKYTYVHNIYVYI